MSFPLRLAYPLGGPRKDVTTFGRVYTVLREALTTVRSAPRALTSTETFLPGLPPGMPGDIRARDAKVRKRAWIGVSSTSVSDDDHSELSNRHHYGFNVLLSFDYYIFEIDFASVEREMIIAADDFPRVREALCWPGALDVTEAGDPTGLAGGALDATGATSSTVIEVVGQGTDRLLNVRARFRGQINWAPVAVP